MNLILVCDSISTFAYPQRIADSRTTWIFHALLHTFASDLHIEPNFGWTCFVILDSQFYLIGWSKFVNKLFESVISSNHVLRLKSIDPKCYGFDGKCHPNELIFCINSYHLLQKCHWMLHSRVERYWIQMNSKTQFHRMVRK